jgi:RNA polymerase primary sigma factor
MFGIARTSRSSPAMHRYPDLDRIILFPRGETAGPDDLEVSAAGSPAGRRDDEGPTPALGIFEPASRRSGKADVGRARRILGAKWTYLAHPSFDDPAAHDAILAPDPIDGDAPARTRPLEYRVSYLAGARDVPVLSREQEAHLFRKMNYLKCLAGRIRDRIDPHRPAAADLDEFERLQAAALDVKNRIVEANLRLVVSVARKRLRTRTSLSERVSDGTFALLLAVDHFDFARGNRFSTYATWAILNELTRSERRERRHRKRSVELFPDSLAAPDSESDRYERDDARARRGATVDRFLRRLDERERRIVANHHGIGGGPEQSLREIGLDLGIGKERVRQLEQRAHAKFRKFVRLESLELSEL